MMATLLLRLAAPLQAWGSDSKFETRKTSREPTKSGVVGLLATALGIRRDEPEKLRPLVQLRFGVRADREGQLLVDFHTARIPGTDKSYVTYRHYLEDAVFLAGLESDDVQFLEQLEKALHYPAFPLYLGRRSCPPTMPLCLGIRQKPLLEALQAEPAQCEHRQETLRIVLDADPQERGAVTQKDVPLSFSPLHRQFGYRTVRETWMKQNENVKQTEQVEQTEHDPFRELDP